MFGDTPLWLIEDEETLARAAELLARAPVIGIDTESDSFHHYQEKVCLVQISDLENDYVVDPLKVPDLSPLAPIFANPRIPKVFHGADYDIVCLKRDFGLQFHNVFDTMIASQFLGLPRFGLADLILRWFGHTVDKTLQRYDWAQRPLREEHLEYARGDSHFLPALRDVMLRKLEALGRLGPVMEECEVVEAREWAGRQHNPGDFYRVKGSKQLDATGLKILHALYTYRDQEARAMDRPAFKVIPDHTLLELATLQLDDPAAVLQRLRPGSPLARRHGDALCRLAVAALTDESPLPAEPARESSGGPGMRGREAERLFGALKEWRNAQMARTGLSSITVISNGQLREITRAAPLTLDELAKVPELRKWQIARFGEEIVALVAANSREPVSDAEGARTGRRRRRRRRPEDGEAAE